MQTADLNLLFLPITVAASVGLFIATLNQIFGRFKRKPKAISTCDKTISACDRINVEPKVEPYYAITFTLGGLVFCDRCKNEVSYGSQHPESSDENYYDQAVAMEAQGWVICARDYRVLCPACARERSARIASEDQMYRT